MIWILQLPAWLLASVAVAVVVGLSVGGLIVFRKAVSHTRLENADAISGLVFHLHPFVGALSVKPDPYVNVLQIWMHEQSP